MDDKTLWISYASKFENLDDMDKFLGKQKLITPSQEETENQNILYPPKKMN